MFPGGHFYLGEASHALVDEIVKEVRLSQTSLAPRLAGAAI
jgi:surfactin synthase thioesterase subunit